MYLFNYLKIKNNYNISNSTNRTKPKNVSLNQGYLSTIKNLDNSEFLCSFLTKHKRAPKKYYKNKKAREKLTSDKIDKKKLNLYTIIQIKNCYIRKTHSSSYKLRILVEK